MQMVGVLTSISGTLDTILGVSEMEWQPIETAPETHRPILGFGDGVAIESCVYVMCWCILEGWMCWYSDVRLTPTHWMPLPKPPSTKIER